MTLVRGALLLVLAMSAQILAQEVPSHEGRPSISVIGEAVVNVQPNRVEISLGIETSDNRIVAAKQKNNDILKKALAAIKESGVPDKEVQTDYLSVEPRYYEEGVGKRSFLGYFACSNLVVTVDGPAKVENLVTKMLEVGVNYIRGIHFQTTELKKAREQARELALKAAKEKADKMAAVLNQRVGKPLSIMETPSGSAYFGGQQAQAQVAQDQTGGGGDSSETIALGKLAVRASVAVVFELRD